ncbi:hypothetical protein ACHQM5_002380 [Ranunculus cassubicifolius]
MKIYPTMEPTTRITRARAAAINASKATSLTNPCTKAFNCNSKRPAFDENYTAPVNATGIQQKRRAVLKDVADTSVKTCVGNLKRKASDDNNAASVNAMGIQHKRRAVLKDVTNICRGTSKSGCAGAAKIQTRNLKPVARVSVVEDAKVVPVATAEIPAVRKDGDSLLEVRGITESQVAALSLNLEKSVSIKQCNRSGESNCFAVLPHLEGLVTRKPLHHLKPLEESTKSPDCYNEIANIDSDQKDPQMCSQYAPDIYRSLRVRELTHRPTPNYMQTLQRDITESMRGILVDWLVEVSEEYKLTSDTLYLSIYLIDCFLSLNYIERQRLQLLGITCILIASKYEEICAPHVEDFCFITDNTYKRAEVLKMESRVLNDLGFHLTAPTVKTFLRRYLHAAHASIPNAPIVDLKFLTCYLAELTLLDYACLKFLPSLIAASCVFLATWTLLEQSGDKPWNPTLEYYTNYKAEDLKSGVFALYNLQVNSNGSTLNAVREKYGHDKFRRVSALSSSKPPESLFFSKEEAL